MAIEFLLFTPDVSCPQEDMLEKHRTQRTNTEVHVPCSWAAAGKRSPTPAPRKHAGERREEESSAFLAKGAWLLSTDYRCLVRSNEIIKLLALKGQPGNFMLCKLLVSHGCRRQHWDEKQQKARWELGETRFGSVSQIIQVLWNIECLTESRISS